MHVTFCTQKYNFDKVTAILTLTFQALVSDIDYLWWRVMGGDGERGKAWLRARGHHLCLTDTIFSFFLVGGAGELAFYFVGTLENNSLFLGNKTNVRECLKIILRNKADHTKKTNFFAVAVSLPAHLYSPYPTHVMALLGNNYSFLVLLLEKNHGFFLLRSNVRKCMQNIFQPTYPSQNTG